MEAVQFRAQRKRECGMIEIPLQALPAQRLNIVLDGQNCTIHVYWRFGRCYMDLAVDSNDIFCGAICQARQAINQSLSTLFSGKLYFFDTLGQDYPPQWEGLGARWRLAYFTDGETPESVAAELMVEQGI